MKDSATLRAEARAALAENSAYWLYFGGLFLMGLALVAVIVPFTLGLIAIGPAMKAMGVAIPETFGQLFASSDGAVLLLVLLAVAAAYMFVLIYAIGFVTWSKTAMALAASRRGLRLGHAFSGFGNGWRMGWIVLVYMTYMQLWLLLLVVPGIYKAFAYALVPYVAIDHPDWSANRCITESRRLMRGNKWRLFCLNFSFIGWYVLVFLASMLPVLNGVAAYFLGPYVDTASARFYEELLDVDDANFLRETEHAEGVANA